MKFVKISGAKSNGEPWSEWRCVISNYTDLFAYSNFEAQLMSQAFMQLEKTFEGDRFDAAHAGDKKTGALATLLNLRAERLKDGESMSPIVEVSKIHAAKVEAMRRMLDSGMKVCINSAGGYCDLDSFLKIWSATIIETVEKEDQGFPIDNEALKADTLILENQDDVSRKFMDIVSTMTESKPVVITHLREKDKKWIVKSMMNAKALAFSSSFQHKEQISEFLTIFDKMPRKRVIIGYYDDLGKLTSHPSYERIAAKHDVALFNLSIK